MPFWVQIGLWGIPSRGAALAYLWVTAAAAAGSLLLGFFFPFAWVGLTMLLATWWYWASIRWADRHGHWKR
jgi:hypothetical protein